MTKRKITTRDVRNIAISIFIGMAGITLAGIVQLSLSSTVKWFEKSVGKEITIIVNGELHAGTLSKTNWELCDSVLGFVGYRIEIEGFQVPGKRNGLVAVGGVQWIFSPWELNRIQTKDGIDYDYYQNWPGD